MQKSTSLSGIGETAWRSVTIGLVIAVMATSCAGGIGEAGTVADKITVTFDGDQCAYNGPAGVPAGQITVILDVEDQKDHDEYGLAVVTLDEGKTFDDLDAWPSTGQPPWAQLHGLLEEILQGSRSEMTVAAFEGPLFLVCFTAYPVTKTGVLGPVEVVD